MFQGINIKVNHQSDPRFFINSRTNDQDYNNLTDLIEFLNMNYEFYMHHNSIGNIVVVDDQFVNQTGIRLNFSDLGLNERLVALSNGGETIEHF